MSDHWRSSLEIYDMAAGTARVILRTPRLIEAPNWHPDGWLLVNGEGRLWRVDPDAPDLDAVDTGGLNRCNNDHGILPDGRIVLSCHDGTGSGIYLLIEDGPRAFPLPRPSWWHGAQGDRLAYACARGGDRVVRIATCDLNGHGERVLTPGRAHHDGPDFSPDGRHIWFNSDATGHAQIWRMNADGSDVAPVFRDDGVNWFPHPSPCGSHIIYLAYPPETEGHPRDLDVALWRMDPDGGNRVKLLDLFGGQGTINVPSWAPDGSAFAFMRYAPEA